MNEPRQPTARWKRLWSLFEELVDATPEVREKRLRDIGVEDSRMRREVEELLNADEEGLSILDRPPVSSGATDSSPSLEPGTVLAGRFEIVRVIGAGGGGEVYEAIDRELRRRVAVKSLHAGGDEDADVRARFLREIHLAQQVTHRNVCRVFDLVRDGDRSFVTMELLDGETLGEYMARRGRLSIEECTPIVGQIAAALEASHAAGIIHRDLKPDNVVLVEDSGGPRVVVTDFGLATWGEARASGAGEGRLTLTGHAVGTPSYMAPEQLEARPVGPATDVYALGLLLFEMVTGTRPVSGSSVYAVARDRLVKPAPAASERVPDLDPRWDRVISQCLERDPADRLQGPGEVFRALTDHETPIPPSGAVRRHRAWVALVVTALVVGLVAWWLIAGRTRPGGEAREPAFSRAAVETPASSRADPDRSAPVAPASPTVAVLPFHNLTNTQDLDYLRFAVPDEITTALSYAPTLDVRPFSITRRYASPDVDPISAGRQVEVETIVTGQFSREGEALHVTLEAIDVGSSSVLWRDRVSAGASDLIGVRQLLSETVRADLLPLFDAAPGGSGTTPTDPAAYRKYLRSLAIGNDPGSSNQEAIRLLEEAAELDPGFAPIWSQLSWRYSVWYAHGGGGRHAQEQAIETAQRALDLDPNQMPATRQLVLLYTESARLREAYDLARAALDRYPGSAEAHFALSYVYRYAGLLDEAARECEAAWAIDSTAPQFRSCAVVFYRLGDYSRARGFSRLDEGSRYQHLQDAIGALYQGDLDETQRIWQSWQGEPPLPSWMAACGFDATPETRAAAVESGPTAPLHLDPEAAYNLARRLTYCGAHDLAMRSLWLAIEKNYCAVSAFESELPFAPLRDHPDFEALHQRAIACQQRFLDHRDAAR